MIIVGGFFQASQQRSRIRYRTVLVRGCTPNFDNILRGCAFARHEFIFNLRREIREKGRIGKETLQHAFSDIFSTNAGLKIKLPPRLPAAAITAGSAPTAEAACGRWFAVPTLSGRAIGGSSVRSGAPVFHSRSRSSSCSRANLAISRIKASLKTGACFIERIGGFASAVSFTRSSA